MCYKNGQIVFFIVGIVEGRVGPKPIITCNIIKNQNSVQITLIDCLMFTLFIYLFVLFIILQVMLTFCSF